MVPFVGHAGRMQWTQLNYRHNWTWCGYTLATSGACPFHSYMDELRELRNCCRPHAGEVSRYAVNCITLKMKWTFQVIHIRMRRPAFNHTGCEAVKLCFNHLFSTVTRKSIYSKLVESELSRISLTKLSVAMKPAAKYFCINCVKTNNVSLSVARSAGQSCDSVFSM